MNTQRPIFCCPSSVHQYGQTIESLDQRLEPFVAWARERSVFQGPTPTGEYLYNFLIEVVRTRMNVPRQPVRRLFAIWNEQSGPTDFREISVPISRQMGPATPVEECRILICNDCQLSFTIFLYKKQPPTNTVRP